MLRCCFGRGGGGANLPADYYILQTERINRETIIVGLMK